MTIIAAFVKGLWCIIVWLILCQEKCPVISRNHS